MAALSINVLCKNGISRVNCPVYTFTKCRRGQSLYTYIVLTPKVWGGGGLRAKYLLPCICIRDSIKFDLQHDHVLKKLNLDLRSHPRVRGRAGVYGHNFCYHIATFVIPVNLICNMNMF